ncbi:MAG TPA: ZIP family metal transporter [Candidatus Omnitrophota bacterium]|nr:ZIP family metal transporter [Candidatus Omnitrophota bacterium]HRY85361.1 ZIP family metal transporter [Candidatus Omnitrophota bacterium]
MEALLKGLHPVTAALLAGLFTWAMTGLGAATIFIFRRINQKILDVMLGFAAGIMIAASFWSLLAPSIEMAEEQGMIPWLPALIGFLLGAAFFRLIDKILPHLHPLMPDEKIEGIKTGWPKCTLLVLALTIHNIPEGLAVGVAFGSTGAASHSISMMAALALAVGIGIQNFPEGLAVSFPLHRDGFSKGKSFWYGWLSGVVEPVAAVTGAAVVMIVQPLLPYALAFAAGAMIFVVVEEVIPESQQNGNGDLATTGTILGFALMMLLDVAFGK